MHNYAQTNLQLLGQIRSSERASDEQMQMICRAYKLAMRLFAGRYRPSGKTFIAHVVGTASILVTGGASADVVAAGLLHSAYDNGDFGGVRPNASKANRSVVREAVGPSVEDYIKRYSDLQWWHRRFDEIIARIPEMDRRDRDVLRIRLADKIEDHLDLGVLYCPAAPKLRSFQYRRDKMIHMAELLEDAFLASELKRISRSIMEAEDFGIRFSSTDSSFSIQPSSCRLRTPIAVARIATAAARRARNKIQRIAVPTGDTTAGNDTGDQVATSSSHTS